MNALNIPIIKENNVLCLVTQKVHKHEWNVYNVCQPQKGFSRKKIHNQSKKNVSGYFQVKNKLGMFEWWCEIKPI